MSSKTSISIWDKDWLIAPIFEGVLILLVGVIGLAMHSALLFSSLGATAYEQIEKSRSRTARPYNIIAGHIGGIIAGFVALAILNAWAAPEVLSAHYMTSQRVWAGVIGVALTVLVNTLVRAQQPAACSTSLLVSLGTFQTLRISLTVVGAVILLAILGEPLRRLRIRTTDESRLH